jgi:hypothetical protein
VERIAGDADFGALPAPRAAFTPLALSTAASRTLDASTTCFRRAWLDGPRPRIFPNRLAAGEIHRGASSRDSRDIRFPYNLSFGDFQLGGDGDFVRAFHAWRAPSSELAGTKTRQDCEFECAELRRTMYHTSLPF